MKFMFMIYHDENVLDAMPEKEMQPLVDSAIESALESLDALTAELGSDPYRRIAALERARLAT